MIGNTEAYVVALGYKMINHLYFLLNLSKLEIFALRVFLQQIRRIVLLQALYHFSRKFIIGKPTILIIYCNAEAA